MAQEALLDPLTPPSGPNLHAVAPDQGRVWRFRIDGHPEPQGSWVAFVAKHTGRAIAVPSNKKVLNAWREQVALTAKALRPAWLREPLDDPVFLALTFVRRRPASHLRANGQLGSQATRYPDTRPDVDKLVRAMLDGLTDVAFVDDARVVSIVAAKRWAEPGEAEGVDVELTAL